MKPSRSLALQLLLLVVASFLAGCAVRPMTVRGDLQGELLWQGTVLVDGDVVVGKGARLTILPGTSVLFLPAGAGADRFTGHPHFDGSELIVRGTVVAEGTAAAPITFRHLDPLAPAGGWGGINLVESPHASFRFCRFTQADSALHSQGSQVFVEESIFERNLVGLRFHSSAMLIEHNRFRDNGTAIRFHFGAPVICRNEIADNDRGFFITSFPQAYRIEGNNIVGNREASVVLGEEVPDDVLMAGNYWGSGDAVGIEGTFFDGRRVDYLGRVIYRPLLERPCPGAGISWKR